MAIGTGNPKIKFNTRERVLSSDANRVQSMAGKHLVDAFRFLLDGSAEEDDFAGAVEDMSDGSETPLSGVVFGGLRPRPIDGTVDLLITAGSCLLADNASPGTDDSFAAIITDPGVQTTGVLTLTTGGASVRIDVIECQRVTVVVETQNRDIFNPATGLFAPAQVDKVTVGRLAYRIRTGTAGSGYPGAAAGWMPLAVCRVAAGATSWDNVILWDVRPLASDRWNAPFNTPRTIPERGRAHVFSDVTTSAGQVRVSGLVEAQFGAYRAGGHLGVTSTLDATGYFDVALVANRASNHPGFTLDLYWYLYAVFPFGLPRWVRYTDSGSGGRVPRGQRGILAVTAVKPGFDGRPTGVGIGTPTNLGLSYVGVEAVVLLSGRVTGSGTPTPEGVACDGRITTMLNATDVANTPSGVVAGVSAQWQIQDGREYPAGARAIWVRFSANFQVSAAKAWTVEGDVKVTGPDAASATLLRTQDLPWIAYATNGASVVPYSAICRIPLVSNPFDPAQSTSLPRDFRVYWTFNSDISGLTGVTDAAHNFQVVGWEMGP